jgi:signal transduction histidine kinase
MTTCIRCSEDHQGRLWMSSSRGVFHVRKQELDALARGQIKAVSSVAYTTADGLKSSECTGDSQPAGWLTRDARLWFPTIRGIVVIDPADNQFNALPPPVYVEQMMVDNQPLIGSGSVRLPPGPGEIMFRYTGLSLVAPEEVRFKYKLEGLETQWTDAGARREAYYTNLPPGDYRFRVIAANNDGVWNEGGAEFAFSIAPRFYQTNWFYALCAMIALLVGLGAHRLRVRRINREFAAVLAERNRIAREWHDTLVAGFAAISWQLEAGVSKLPEAPQVARQHLEVVSNMVRHSMTEARRALHDLRSQALENGGFVLALSESVKQITAGRALEVQFQIEGAPPRLSGDVENNLMRIGQEAVSNVVNHAEARQVSIALCFQPSCVRLRIKDDGQGFDALRPEAGNREHFGLLGMRERAKKLGATFTLRSAPGSGTEITVEVPVR